MLRLAMKKVEGNVKNDSQTLSLNNCCVYRKDR